MDDPSKPGEVRRVGGPRLESEARPEAPLLPGGPSRTLSRALGGLEAPAGVLESALSAPETLVDFEGASEPEDPAAAGLLRGLREATQARDPGGAFVEPPLWSRQGVVSLIAVGGLLAGCAVGALAMGAAGLWMTVAVEAMAFMGGLLVSRAGQQELEAANRELQFVALHDPLTGLKNRRAIMAMLDDDLGQWGGRRPDLAVVMADVDHFKRINDTYGHPTGDAVLQEIARRTHGALRTEDAVGRYGGEEILIVLPGLGTGEAVRMAERIRQEISGRPIHTAEASLTVTASFGVASTADLEKPTGAGLIALADQALYRAKSAGRNRVEAAG